MTSVDGNELETNCPHCTRKFRNSAPGENDGDSIQCPSCFSIIKTFAKSNKASLGSLAAAGAPVSARSK